MEKKEERREVNNVKEKNTNLVSVERSQICAEGNAKTILHIVFKLTFLELILVQELDLKV